MKPVYWIGSSREDLRDFPPEVTHDIGVALTVAQYGGKHPDAKPLRGFGGASVLEIVENHDGDTYRAVYTVRFAEALYVLHAFQKKSTQGMKTTQRDIDLIKARLQRAQEEHEAWIRARKP
jgi:phage-related protein